MNQQALVQYILTEWQNTSWVEIIAVSFAVCEVLLAYRNKVWLYPAGIISTSLYIWIYLHPSIRLYADAGLNSYYLAMSIYGWIYWSRHKGAKTAVKITHADVKERWIAFAIFLLAFILMYLILNHWTNSNTPLADAFVSSIAWAGMWLLARRKIENWIVLNISNAAAVPLLLYKHLPLTALLTIFLFIVAILGYRKWKHILSAYTQEESAKVGIKQI